MKTPKKLVRYSVAVSRFFPSTHIRKGEKTEFVDSIYFGKKLHTIRKNYPMWAKRMEKVNRGEAVIDLFYWKLKGGRYTPGNEKVVFATLDKNSGCGVQELTKNDILPDGWYAYTTDGDEELYSELRTEILAKNDGLSLNDFKAWFKSYDLSEAMALIHFTKFRY